VLDVERFDSRPVMIGDRRHDVEGAHAHGLEAVGVLWGYGSRAELEAAGADALVASMPELEEWASRARGIGSDTRGAGGEPERR
jgi:phosphoglycolate phosphatase